MKGDDELIAEFMGYTNDRWWHLNKHEFDPSVSWDDLMPVVEKIESIEDPHHGYFGVHISSNACHIQGTNLWKSIEQGSTYGPVYMSDPNAILSTKLESTYYNVVQFIKWYNSQKTGITAISHENP